jgi:hypothetical protein
MLASQVCDRLVASQKQRRPTSERARHHLEVSNYFHRAPERTPPGGTARNAPKPASTPETATSPEAPAPAAPALAAGPGPATPPIAPEPAPVAPAPRIQIDPEVIVSWGSWTRAELYAQAKELDIRGRSSMTKKMLLKALVAYVRGD